MVKPVVIYVSAVMIVITLNLKNLKIIHKKFKKNTKQRKKFKRIATVKTVYAKKNIVNVLVKENNAHKNANAMAAPIL